jgi:Tfp pilus assembly protein PilE
VSKLAFRRGFTFVESLMVTVLALVVLGSLFYFLYTGARMPARTADQMDAVADVRRTLDRLMREVREARHVLYPQKGQSTQNALCVVNGKSEIVMYRLVPVAGTSLKNLVRFKRGASDEIVLRQVSRLDVTSANPAGGDEPILVHFVLTRQVTGAGVKADAAVSMVAAAARHTDTCRCLSTELGAGS